MCGNYYGMAEMQLNIVIIVIFDFNYYQIKLQCCNDFLLIVLIFIINNRWIMSCYLNLSMNYFSGVLYMCLKHYIDRYNIYYVYGPSKISRNIHATAINFVIISIILMQMCVFFFLYLRNGKFEFHLFNVCLCKIALLLK